MLQEEIKEQEKHFKNKMAIDVEQFTAPGKYAIDSNMEEIERLLKIECGNSHEEKTQDYSTNKTGIKYNSTKNK